MNDSETAALPETAATNRKTKPRRANNTGFKVKVNKIQDGRAIDFGTYPAELIGEPLEQRLLPFLQERNYGPGDWKLDIRNARGHFVTSYDVTVPGNDPDDREHIIDADDTFEDEEMLLDEYPVETQQPGQMTKAEVDNLILTQRIKQLEEQRSGQQNESNAMLGLLQSSWNQQREFMMLMLQQAQTQTQKPQQDPTTMALDLMEKSFGMVTRARAFAEEIAPGERSGGDGDGGGILADGAKLLDSVGRNAGTFMPLIAPIVSGLMTPKPPPVPTGYVTPAATANGGGEMADLAARARNNGTSKEEQKA